jgi:hypothetical protein
MSLNHTAAAIATSLELHSKNTKPEQLTDLFLKTARLDTIVSMQGRDIDELKRELEALKRQAANASSYK